MSQLSAREQPVRILYIEGTLVPPASETLRNRFCWLSNNLQGEVLQRVWWGEIEEITQRFGEGSFPSHQIGSFRYHWMLAKGLKGLSGWFRTVRFFIGQGYRIHRDNPVDCIVVYSHMTTGLCGSILKMLTGAKLVIEIATSPEHVALSESPKPGLSGWLRFYFSEIALHVSVLSADRIHLLAPDLLQKYRFLRHRAKSVFHEFVTFSSIESAQEPGEPYILFVGAPWYLKGVDILIRAFQGLSGDFPEVQLRLLGHFPDRQGLDRLIDSDPRIEVLKPRPNPEALKMIAGARVLVLPSRCEGMGRVLIEAMAAGVPVVGSDVGGIPYIVRDGENGFVFPREDAEALEVKLRTILSDPDLARRLGARGREIAGQEFTEQRYVEHFVAMVQAAVKGLP